MKNDRGNWLEEIKNHTLKCRASRPLSAGKTLSLHTKAQLSIIKDSLLLWIDNLPKQQPLNDAAHGEPEICIVFTSTCSGLAAAKEVAMERDFPLLSLYPEEYSEFLLRLPDTQFKNHAHIWSYIVEKPDSETAGIAGFYPLDNNEKYWLHVEGIMLGRKLGRGLENLWCWNGSQARLLRKNLRQWAS